MAVRIVPYEPMNKPLQCYNCQEFSHGASHCRRRTTCLHCAGEHSHKHCPTKCTGDGCKHCCCANCGGPHPSISHSCPKRPSDKTKNRPKTFCTTASTNVEENRINCDQHQTVPINHLNKKQPELAPSLATGTKEMSKATNA
jgi:hypothetical protein